MKGPHVNTADCSGSKLVSIAKKCGFDVFQGGKHTKVKKKTGEFVTMIPRHERLNRHTTKAIVEALNANGAKITFS